MGTLADKDKPNGKDHSTVAGCEEVQQALPPRFGPLLPSFASVGSASLWLRLGAHPVEDGAGTRGIGIGERSSPSLTNDS